MYQFLFHGSDVETFSLLKAGLPVSMDLRMVADKDHLFEIVGKNEFHGLVLPFSGAGPEPEDLCYLQFIVGRPHIPGVVVVASRLTVSQAVCCMRSGAVDCLIGPITGEILGLVLARIVGEKKLERKSLNGILGESDTMNSFRDRLRKYADNDHPILITGETGSGKELAARSIHRQSRRCDGPFVPVNCAYYTDDLLSSELFGSCRGAFTGSVDRKGLFQSAQGGTVLLDEIGELSTQGQAKLLRVIEEKMVRAVGCNRLKPVDVRILAATNRDLSSSIAMKVFRADLYYRLNLLGICVPPLRRHREDIPLLARSYLRSIAGPSKKIDNTAMSALMKHHWPGNVRELQAVVLKASLESLGETITAGNIYLS